MNEQKDRLIRWTKYKQNRQNRHTGMIILTKLSAGRQDLWTTNKTNRDDRQWDRQTHNTDFKNDTLNRVQADRNDRQNYNKQDR